MLTRCPSCATAFKVTPEQLKLRAGKVRCGKCQSVFNALDSLDETPAGAPVAALPETAFAARPLPPGGLSATVNDSIVAERIELRALDTEVSETLANVGNEGPAAVDASPASPEEVRDAAITHGLVAARETTEIPGYNKWAEGAFAAPTAIAVPPPRPRWPAALAILMLLVALAAQALHQFRTELVVTVPALRPLLESACALVDCDIPLPRHAELVSIEASDLQVDTARGSALVLAATLKNRASYAQAWPLLEITLTDVGDAALIRRVLSPAEYLPEKADPTVFPPNADVAVKLWLEARDVTASGYRLYVFYP